jgi:Tfp pilus assembly protein PilN
VRAINLLPRDDVRRGVEGTQWVVLVPVALALLLTGLLSALFLSASGKVKDRQAELAQAKDTLAAIPAPDTSKLQTQNALAADKLTRVKALDTALSRRVAWDRIFRELSLVLPQDVWLATLSAKAPVSSSAAAAPPPPVGGAVPAASQFTLDGYTYSHAAVARLLSRLSVVPDLVNVQLQDSALTTVGAARTVHFVIAADIRSPEAGS